MSFKEYYFQEDVYTPEKNILFHVTPTKNIEKIKELGIIPKKKPTFTGAIGQDIRKHKESIYAVDTKVDAIRLAFKIEWDSKEPASIITFKRGDCEWKPDDHFEAQMAEGDWLYCQCNVPPEDIINIEPLTPELTKQAAYRG